LEQTTPLQPIQNPGYGGLTEVNGPGEFPDGGPLKLRRLTQHRQLGAGEADLVHKLPGAQLDGMHDSPDGGDNLVFCIQMRRQWATLRGRQEPFKSK
jgi:hypothetical protein